LAYSYLVRGRNELSPEPRTKRTAAMRVPFLGQRHSGQRFGRGFPRRKFDVLAPCYDRGQPPPLQAGSGRD
jgi:hypothetical protein